MTSDRRIADSIHRLLAARAIDATICPSDVARTLEPDDEAAWRALMPEVRRVAAGLARDGEVVVTRGGRVVDAEAPGGPIRIGKPRQ